MKAAASLLLLALWGCVPTPSSEAVEAQLHEAIRWYTGEAGHVDDAKAQTLLLEAAASTHPLPTMWLARCYSRGRMGFAQDSAQTQTLARKALDAVRRLADDGTLEALFLMGSAHDEGLGMAVDPAAAATWFHKAGARGHVLAQHNLGNAYFSGRGVPQNDSAAAYWWREAAREGDAIAQYRLGFMYEAGRGVPQSDSAATRWYQNAANRGEKRAQEALQRREE